MKTLALVAVTAGILMAPASRPAHAETLARLAHEKFGTLTWAEEQIVAAAPKGDTAECVVAGEGTDPAQADGWSSQRIVRGKLIRWICVDTRARQLVDPRGLRIRGAIVVGTLDLSFAHVPFPLEFDNCLFPGDGPGTAMTLAHADIPGVALSGSRVDQLLANGLKVEGDLALDQNFHTDHQVLLQYVEIGGALDLSSGTFLAGLAVDASHVRGNLVMSNLSAAGEITMLGTEVGGDLIAYGAGFESEAQEDGSPGDALSADRVRVGGDVTVEGGAATGNVSFLGADIGGSFILAKAFAVRGGGGVSGETMVVHHDVFLSNGFSAEGEVRLLGAQIGGDVQVYKAQVAAVSLDRAHIGGRLVWQQIDRRADLMLRLTGASVEALADDRPSWPDAGRLDLAGFQYHRLEGVSDAQSRLAWLRLQTHAAFVSQPYVQLAKVLRDAHDEDGATQVLMAMEDDRAAQSPWWRRCWARFLKWTIGYGYAPWRAGAWALLVVVLGWVTFALGRATFATCSAAEGTPADAPTSESARAPDGFNALAYSIESFLPGVDLGQRTRFEPLPHRRAAISVGRWRLGLTGAAVRVVLWFEILTGWVLVALLTAALTGILQHG